MTAWLVHQGDRPLHHLQQQLRVRHVHVERARTGLQNVAESGWGPHAWDMLAPRRSTGMAALLTARWFVLLLGARVARKRSTYMGAQHRAGNGQPKVNGGHATGACWAPRAVHRDICLHCTLLPQPTRRRHQGRQHARIIPVLVLVWRRWTESRCSRIDLPGPHKAVSSERHAACWWLFPLIDGAALRAFLRFKI